MGAVDSFRELQEAARLGSYYALTHFKARAAERGFTIQQALDLLAQDSALAWHLGGFTWLVTEPLLAEPGRHSMSASSSKSAARSSSPAGSATRSERRNAGPEGR